MTEQLKNSEEKQLFAQALIEAFERKYDEALASAADIGLSDTSPISFERIYARIRSQRRRKTAMLVAAILAALMLCGCTAYVYREKLAGLLLEYTSVGTTIKQTTAPEIISETAPCYGLSYIPEGYELLECTTSYLNASYKWKNNNNKKIIFCQTTPLAAFSANNKGTEKYVIEHNGNDVLCMQIDKDYYFYGWKHGSYILVLVTNDRFTNEEITRIIDGLVITEYISKP